MDIYLNEDPVKEGHDALGNGGSNRHDVSFEGGDDLKCLWSLVKGNFGSEELSERTGIFHDWCFVTIP